MKTQPLDRNYPTVPLLIADQRLRHYSIKYGVGPYKAASLAAVIWPARRFRSNQGAGAAATRVLKALGFRWGCLKHKSWGWLLEA